MKYTLTIVLILANVISLFAQTDYDLQQLQQQGKRLKDVAYLESLTDEDLMATLVDSKKDTITFPEVLSLNHGKVVLVYLWFIDCPPCRKTIPKLRMLEQQYPEQLSVIYLDVVSKDYEWLRALPSVGLDAAQFSYFVFDRKTAPAVKNLLLRGGGKLLLFDQQGRLCNPHAPLPDRGLRRLLVQDYFD